MSLLFLPNKTNRRRHLRKILSDFIFRAVCRRTTAVSAIFAERQKLTWRDSDETVVQPRNRLTVIAV